MDWKPASRNRALTAEEAELWTHTMRDAKALTRRERARKAGEGHAPATDEIPRVEPDAPPPPPALRHPELPPRPASPPKSPPLAAYDEKERRRLGKHPDLIDARLDLHGFRQREAHAALRSFLLSCAVRGHKHVLIITGKGAAAERQRDFYGDERGVLRRLVPQWLGDPEFRAIVVSYSTSHIRHGGDGALYVRLRKAGPR